MVRSSTAPPVPSSLVTTTEPSDTSASGNPRLCGSGTTRYGGASECPPVEGGAPQVPAGRVDAAPQQVPDEGGVRDAVPVVERPAEFVADRADEQRGVG